MNGAIQPFWDKACNEFSKKLWKPTNDFCEMNKDETSHWDCDNKNISFHAYESYRGTNEDIKFKPMPVENNQSDKKKIFFSAFSTEIKRFEKKVLKNNIKQIDIKKYIKTIKKIKEKSDKIKNINTKHKNFYIKITKALALFKNKINKKPTEKTTIKPKRKNC